MTDTVVPVSVAITTLDRPDALTRCLRSLAAGAAAPAQVVIVDQSPSRTAESVAHEAADLTEVRYHHDDGRGLGRGQNMAVRLTSHEVVAVLDDDCVASDDWVECAHRLLSGDGLGLVGGRVLPLADDRPDAVPVSSRTSVTRRDFRGRAAPWDLGSGNNFAFRREWFERIGGNDERLGPGSPGQGGVDMDLFYRMLRAGAPARYEPKLLVLHEQKLPEERHDRRALYGFGMAAACMLWLREGRDRYALRVLWQWLGLRAGVAVRALGRGRWAAVRDELLVLGGTCRGLVYGCRVARRPT